MNPELRLAILSKIFILSTIGVLTVGTTAASLYQSLSKDRQIDGTLILGLIAFWVKMPEFGSGKKEGDNTSEGNLEVTNIDNQTNIVGVNRFPRADFEDER